MAYHQSAYFMMFLPVVLLCYQVAPKRVRWGVLLFFSIIFYLLFSRYLIVYLFAATVCTYLTGRLLQRSKDKCVEACKKNGLTRDEKKEIKNQYKKSEKRVVACGIVVLLGILLVLKYAGFFAENMNVLLTKMHVSGRLPVKTMLLPLGISFYTMSAISYIVDVYWGKFAAEKNFGKLALFLCFFPTVMEGPICMYTDVSDTLTRGEALNCENLKNGAVRIMWGLLKKVVIADRLYVIVSQLFDNYQQYHGCMILVAAISYTLQLYMEFSGCMDIVIGSAELFGIKLPENFEQPFLSKNASEFWRRWHISLGRWFKTYIFYPISMSKMVKRWNKYGKKHVGEYCTRICASAMALFPVWMCNGLWHGANWSYIFYGFYYFVVILAELMLEPPMEGLRRVLHVKEDSTIWNGLRVLKTWCIIFVGELFFRAATLPIGIKMFSSMFRDFHISELWNGSLLTLGLGRAELFVAIAACVLVAIAGYFREKKVNIRNHISGMYLPVRWAIYIGLMLIVIIFGAYGPGYMEVDLIYAGF